MDSIKEALPNLNESTPEVCSFRKKKSSKSFVTELTLNNSAEMEKRQKKKILIK